MSNYNDLIELRNRLLNDDLTVFEEDCQLLDRVLDDYEQKDQRIAELEKELEKTKCLYNNSIDREIFLTDEERRTYYKNVELKKENAELKQKLADLKGEKQ